MINESIIEAMCSKMAMISICYTMTELKIQYINVRMHINENIKKIFYITFSLLLNL